MPPSGTVSAAEGLLGHDTERALRAPPSRPETSSLSSNVRDQVDGSLLPVSEIVVLVDSDGRIIRSSCQNAGTRLGQFSLGQGKSVHDALHRGCRNGDCDLVTGWARAWKAHLAGRPVEWEWLARGTDWTFKLRLQPVSYACGALFGNLLSDYADFSVLFIEDITRSRRNHESDVAVPTDDWSSGELTDERFRTAAGRLLASQEAERNRIAAELHDGLGQTLSLLRFEIEGCIERAAACEDAHQTEALRRAYDHVKRSLGELRTISSNLRPTVIMDLGLLGSLDLLCSEFRTVCPAVTLRTEFIADEQSVPNKVAVAVYRICQEALHNVARHAGADEATLVLATPDGGVELLIADDGVGLPPVAAVGCGLGLLTMRERVESLGGDFRFNSEAGAGCSVRARWTPELILRLGQQAVGNSVGGNL